MQLIFMVSSLLQILLLDRLLNYILNLIINPKFHINNIQQMYCQDIRRILIYLQINNIKCFRKMFLNLMRIWCITKCKVFNISWMKIWNHNISIYLLLEHYWVSNLISNKNSFMLSNTFHFKNKIYFLI